MSLESRSSSTSYMPLLTLEKIKIRLWVYSIIVIISANKFKAFGLLVIPAIWSSLSINCLILCAPTDTTISKLVDGGPDVKTTHQQIIF